MASKVIDGTSAAAPDDEPAEVRGHLPVQALASYPGLVLPLLLIAAALAVTVFASVQLWRMEARPLQDPTADMPRLYAQAAVEALRLNEAAEHHAGDPAARQEFIRLYHLLLRRLDQLEPVLRDRPAAAAVLDDEIANALIQLRDRDPAVVAYSPGDLAGLAARLTELERTLSRAGARVQGAHQAQQAERAARLYGILVLGAAAVLAGLLGLAWLVSCLLWTLRRVQDDRKLQLDLQRACDSAAYLRNIAAVIAHQMRAPLTVIDSAAQRMLSRPDLAQRPQDGAALLRIRRQVSQVLRFMDQAMLAGAVLAAARRRACVVVDGVIVTAAAVLAHAMEPSCLEACVFAHRSAEPGHDDMLAHLGVRPLLDLGLRLGEGTGALLAVPLLQAAASMLSDMADLRDVT